MSLQTIRLMVHLGLGGALLLLLVYLPLCGIKLRRWQIAACLILGLAAIVSTLVLAHNPELGLRSLLGPE